LSAAGVGPEAPADRPGILDSEGAVAVARVFDLTGDLQAGGLDPVIEIIGLWRDDVEPVRGRPVPGPDDNAAAAVGPAQFDLIVTAGLIAWDQPGRLESEGLDQEVDCCLRVGIGTLGQIVGGRSGELGVTAVVTLVAGRVMPSACVRGAPRSWKNRNSPAIHPAGLRSASRFQPRVRSVGSEPNRQICAPR
jgi:hypothetical protein